MNATRRTSSRRSVGPLRHLALACVLVASLTLSACGSDGDDPKAEPSSSPSVTMTPTPTPTPDNPGAVAHREIGTFSATGLRPVDDGSLVILKGAQGARTWLEGLGATPQVVDEVSTAIETAAVADDETLQGYVLHTGCLAPKSWTLVESEDMLRVHVVPDEKEATSTCIAAVTTLAIVAVPNDD